MSRQKKLTIVCWQKSGFGGKGATEGYRNLPLDRCESVLVLSRKFLLSAEILIQKTTSTGMVISYLKEIRIHLALNTEYRTRNTANDEGRSQRSGSRFNFFRFSGLSVMFTPSAILT